MADRVFRIVILALLVAAAAEPTAGQTPVADGEQVYTMHCARCHDDTQPRMPTRDAPAGNGRPARFRAP